ncbi:MAG: proteasome assembly chaperone family protein [Canidatus Methanoxibalbensis ujae]|nr:proteasome assembly chaperone family protein [Candidatus Methanoxibalbensis ujae]MCW7079281.1 proteasome assembly chaperone family protein [Candidatus Methanoxibalbensis ujae]
MNGNDTEVRIVERKKFVYERPIAVEGLPDIGLVGTIATTFLVEKMNFMEIGYIESELFPPVMVVHGGHLKNPFRIYGGYIHELAERDHTTGSDEASDTGHTAEEKTEEEKINIVLIASEIAVPPQAVFPLTRSLAAWLKRINTSLAISLTGLPVRNRIEIEVPEVFGVGNYDEAVEDIKSRKLEVLEEGFIAGIYASMLRECRSNGVKAISLLTQCFPAYPDPGAAASALKALDRFIHTSIDTSELLKRAEEIKLRARDLMKQASIAASQMQRGAEQDLPIMYR